MPLGPKRQYCNLWPNVNEIPEEDRMEQKDIRRNNGL